MNAGYMSDPAWVAARDRWVAEDIPGSADDRASVRTRAISEMYAIERAAELRPSRSGQVAA